MFHYDKTLFGSPLGIKGNYPLKKKKKKKKCYTEKGEREIKRKERQRNREAEIERRVPPKSSTITLRAPFVSPIRILSFRFLFNFLNMDACDPKIEKEEK